VLRLLRQRDGDVAPEGLTLPLVAGAAAELDVEDEGLRLAGLQDAEVPAGGQLGDRRQRRLTCHGADGDAELVVVERRVGGRGVAEVAADLDVTGDGSVVANGERLRDQLLRCEVVEVEIDRPAVVGVADAKRKRGGVDVDASGVSVAEVGVRKRCATEHDDRRGHEGCADAELLRAGHAVHDVSSL